MKKFVNIIMVIYFRCWEITAKEMKDDISYQVDGNLKKDFLVRLLLLCSKFTLKKVSLKKYNFLVVRLGNNIFLIVYIVYFITMLGMIKNYEFLSHVS